jgi:hypothetical protein
MTGYVWQVAALLSFLLLLGSGGCQGVSRPQTDSVSLPVPLQPSPQPEVPPPASSEATADKHAGPFFELLRLTPLELEQRVGKPSEVREVGAGTGVYTWTYQNLGLAFDITTQIATGKQFITGFVQTKGRIVGAITVGDTEEHVVEVAGPAKTSLRGDRFVQLADQGILATVFIKDGRVEKAFVTRIGTDR